MRDMGRRPWHFYVMHGDEMEKHGLIGKLAYIVYDAPAARAEKRGGD